MHGWRKSLGICWLGWVSACGGQAADFGGPTIGGVSSGAGAGGSSGTSGGSVTTLGGGSSRGGASSGGSGGSATGGTFTDPGCPAVQPPPATIECDPVVSGTQCMPGAGCYPYVQHPFGEGCGAETFGAVCLPVGTSVQGEPCDDSPAGCAPGYICVIGAHAGRRCAKLCTFQGADECPPGMICGDTDIQGYGVCN